MITTRTMPTATADATPERLGAVFPARAAAHLDEPWHQTITVINGAAS